MLVIRFAEIADAETFSHALMRTHMQLTGITGIRETDRQRVMIGKSKDERCAAVLP
jgi:hypothetical protein